MAASSVFPVRAVALRVTFSIVDTDGNLITGWTTPACQVSKDGAAFASVGTPVEIGTSGVGYVDLTSPEMDAKSVTIKATVANAGAVERVIVVITDGLSEIATAVWASVTRTLSSYGTLVNDVAAAILDTPANLLVTNASGQVECSNLTDTAAAVWAATIPDWTPSEPLTYGQMMAYFRVLDFYKSTLTGASQTLYNRSDVAVATMQVTSTDITGFRAKPVAS